MHDKFEMIFIWLVQLLHHIVMYIYDTTDTEPLKEDMELFTKNITSHEKGYQSNEEDLNPNTG